MRMSFANAPHECNSFPCFGRRAHLSPQTQYGAPEMTTINMIRSSSNPTATTLAALRTTMGSWLAGAWTTARDCPNAIGAARRLLSLNDRLLRDIGENHAELEYEARFWSIWPFHEYYSNSPGSRRS
jgi:uncharacterized protein YjiS (DUF1127 family)